MGWEATLNQGGTQSFPEICHVGVECFFTPGNHNYYNICLLFTVTKCT